LKLNKRLLLRKSALRLNVLQLNKRQQLRKLLLSNSDLMLNVLQLSKRLLRKKRPPLKKSA
jgi:hypothetical protein